MSNRFALGTLGILFPLHSSLALPPPDLIISGLQSVVQVFGVVVAFLVSAFFLLKDTLKMWWQLHRRLMVTGIGLLLLLVAAVGWWLWPA